MSLLIKAHVKQHMRATKTGKVGVVHDFERKDQPRQMSLFGEDTQEAVRTIQDEPKPDYVDPSDFLKQKFGNWIVVKRKTGRTDKKEISQKEYTDATREWVNKIEKEFDSGKSIPDEGKKRVFESQKKYIQSLDDYEVKKREYDEKKKASKQVEIVPETEEKQVDGEWKSVPTGKFMVKITSKNAYLGYPGQFGGGQAETFDNEADARAYAEKHGYKVQGKQPASDNANDQDASDLISENIIRPISHGIGKGRFWEYRDKIGTYTVAPSKEEAIKRANEVIDNKRKEQESMSAGLSRKQKAEAEFESTSIRQRLFRAPTIEKHAIAAQMTHDQAKDAIEQLDAAPGDDPEARKAMYAVFPDLKPKAEKNSVKAVSVIMGQIGPKAFAMMGAKNLVRSDDGEGALTFKIGKNPKNVSHVKVTLMPDDTYSVDYYSGSGTKFEKSHEAKGLMGEDLTDNIERNTGLRMSLGGDSPVSEAKRTIEKTPENIMREQIGDIFEIVKPVGNLWKPKGKTIYIEPHRDRPGFGRWLQEKNFVKQVLAAGKKIYKVELK